MIAFLLVSSFPLGDFSSFSGLFAQRLRAAKWKSTCLHHAQVFVTRWAQAAEEEDWREAVR